MDDAKNPKGEAGSKAEADVKSLLAEYLESTRTPIGTSDLFSDPLDLPTGSSRSHRDDHLDSERDLSWAPAICLVSLIMAATVALFLLV